MSDELWAQDFEYKGPVAPIVLIRGTDTIGTDFPAVGGVEGVEVLWEGQVPTPYPFGGTPKQQLSAKFQQLRVGGRTAIVFPAHGWRFGEDPYETRSTEKIGWICWKAGVHWGIGGGTVGSLNNAVWPGDAVVTYDVDDIDQKGKFVGLPGTEYNFVRFKILPRMRQAICPTIANHLSWVAIAKAKFPRVHGYERQLVHVCTDGPFFETVAQVQRLRPYGDVVGQSFMDEVRLARLLGIHWAGFHYSVNPAEGLLPDLVWKLDETHRGCEEQAARVELNAIKTMTMDESCGCMNYRGASRPSRYLKDLI